VTWREGLAAQVFILEVLTVRRSTRVDEKLGLTCHIQRSLGAFFRMCDRSNIRRRKTFLKNLKAIMLSSLA
jgi:hypothetical protein